MLAAGCRREKAEGPVVARGAGFVVTTAELQAKLAEQPPVIRARYEAPERKKEFLENVIRFRLLAAEARRRKLDEDPEIRDALERLMVQKLTRQAFDEKSPTPDEDDLRAYYDAHAAEFQQPERIRISVLSLRVRGHADRAQRAAEARKAYTRLKTEGPKNPLTFSNVARDVSDDASRQAGGDLGFRSRQELAVSWPQIAARLSREQRARAFDAFVTTLRRGADVEIDERELGKVSPGPTAAPAP